MGDPEGRLGETSRHVLPESDFRDLKFYPSFFEAYSKKQKSDPKKQKPPKTPYMFPSGPSVLCMIVVKTEKSCRREACFIPNIS